MQLPLCQLWNLHVNYTVGLMFVYTNIGTQPYIPWAQLGGGHGGRVPFFFRQWGYNMISPPTFF